MTDDKPPFIPMDMSPGDRRPDDPLEPEELAAAPVAAPPAPEPEPAPPPPAPEPAPAPIVAAAPPPPAPPPPPPFEIDPRPTWEPAPLAPRPPWRPPVPKPVGDTDMEAAAMAPTWDAGPPSSDPPPPPLPPVTAATDAFVIDPDHFAIAETEDEDDLIQDRAVGWLGRLFGAHAELAVDAAARAERTRGWTTRTMLIAAVTLLILNAHSLQTWSATLQPQWGSETLRLVSGEWAGQLQAVGLDEPRRRIHAAYQTSKTLHWDGSVNRPVR
jgi:hypothetical protein